MKFAGCYSWLRRLLPPVCPLCGGAFSQAPPEPFCGSCMAGIRPLPAARCCYCALPFVATSATSSHPCGRCLGQRPAYSVTYAAALYEGRLRDAISRFKFQQHPNLDRPLAGLLAQRLPSRYAADVLVPVPLHPQRLRERTYNQALLLARALGQQMQVPVIHDVLAKRRITEPQQCLSADRRRENLLGAFVVNKKVTGKNVLLVDDVMTTGVTVDLCSQLLLDAGAMQVEVAVVARAPLT